jgi:tRNA 2-selenouridine synthase
MRIRKIERYIMNCQTSKDFKHIVLNETPLIDVRAPIEYEKGAFPNAVNLPLMDNEERHVIGIKYKEDGHDDAVDLGYQLVSGENKENKVLAWVRFIEKHPSAMLYCFRGGQRSRISQEWMQEATGKPILRLEGGYKAFRNYLIDALNPEHHSYRPIRLGGCTGSGKTILLKELDTLLTEKSTEESSKNYATRFLDLEEIAHHRGSSFGNFIDPQPTQINFENRLAYKLIQMQAQGLKSLILEDEGRNVGRCFLPKPLVAFWGQKNLVIVDVPLDERIQITRQEYVDEEQAKYIESYGLIEGLKKWSEYIMTSLSKIKKRLGGLAHQELTELFQSAYQEQLSTGSTDVHATWIRVLLADYYDPMYNYQMEKNAPNIIFKGNKAEVMDYLLHLNKN